MYPTREQLRRACEALCARDETLARAYATIGVPEWRIQPANYEALVRSQEEERDGGNDNEDEMRDVDKRYPKSLLLTFKLWSLQQ